MKIWHEVLHNKVTTAVIILCVLNVLLRLPFANIPAFEDEISYFTGVKTIADNQLNPFVNFFGYKPPVMFLISAVMYRLFGPSLIWGRLEIYLFSSAALLFTYLLGKTLFSKEAGFLAFLLLAVYPLFATQSFLFFDSVPFTAFILGSLYFYFSRDMTLYLITATLLVLTKEPGILLPAAVLVFDSVMRKTKKRYILAVPLVVFTLWMAMNKITFGWYLWPHNVLLHAGSGIAKGIDPLTLQWAVHNTLMLNFEWVLVCLVVIGLVILSRKSEQVVRQQIPVMLFLMILTTGYYLFLLIGPIQPRYVLQIFPLLFIVLSAIITTVLGNKSLRILAVSIICLLFINSNYFRTEFVKKIYDDETSFGFLKTIQFTKNTVRSITISHPDAVYIAPSYTHQELENPFWGYVRKQSTVLWADCGIVEHNDIRNLFENESVAVPDTAVFVSSPDETICAVPEKSKGKTDTFCPDRYLTENDCIKTFKIRIP